MGRMDTQMLVGVEGMLNAKKCLAMALAIFLFGVVLGKFLVWNNRNTDCLSSGGSWDYDRNMCEKWEQVTD